MNIFIRNPLEFFDVLPALHFSKCGLYVNVNLRCRREIKIMLGSVRDKLYAFRMYTTFSFKVKKADITNEAN